MKFSQKILRTSNFEKQPVWKSAILDFFFQKKEKKNCLIHMKISHKLCDRMNSTEFWCFPLFPANSLLCVIIRYTVYMVGITSDLVKKSTGGLRVVSGTTLLVHKVHIQAFPFSYTALRGWNLFRSCYFNVRGSLQDSMGWNDFRRKHSHSSVCLLLSDL